MKKITAILIMLFVFTLSSCSSDDPAPSNQDTELYIRFSANGQQYSFEPETITSLQKVVAGYKFENNFLTRISLTMPVVPTVGVHETIVMDGSEPVGDVDTEYSAFFWIGDDIYESTSSTITITAIDSDYIKGTFSFTGVTSSGAIMMISNGTFTAYN